MSLGGESKRDATAVGSECLETTWILGSISRQDRNDVVGTSAEITSGMDKNANRCAAEAGKGRTPDGRCSNKLNLILFLIPHQESFTF
jgi:hypothetical protein